MFSRILVAMDSSPDSDYVFEEALSIAKVTDARLMLMHVLSAVEVECLAISEGSLKRSPHPQAQSEGWETDRQHCIDVLRSRHAAMCDAGISADIGLPAGNPGQQICEMAQRWGANLILLGRRGLMDQEDYLLNSVSNYVLHHAPCAVLVLPNWVKPQVPRSPVSSNQFASVTGNRS